MKKQKDKTEKTVTDLPIVADGKTKTLLKTDSGKLEMVQKPFVTIGDGAKKFIVPNKDEWVNQISYYLFNYLRGQGIPTHLIRILEPNSMLVEEADMLLTEVIVRGDSAGSFTERFPHTAGNVFSRPLVEFNYKGRFEGIEDPLMYLNIERGCFELYKPKERPSKNSYLGDLPLDAPGLPGSEKEIAAMKHLALKIFKLIRAKFKEKGIKVIDMKIELGYIMIDGKRVLALCDTLCPDSMRLEKDGKKMDKQLVRDAGEITEAAVEAYKEVLRTVKTF